MKKITTSLLLLLCLGMVFPFGACQSEAKYLKDAYKDYFQIGAAFSYGMLDYYNGKDIINQFGSMTAENEMKWMSLQPSKGIFYSTNADEMIAVAKSRGMKVRGHALVWHSSAPSWIFQNAQGKRSSQDVLDEIEAHIRLVMPHFENDVYVWDVVNEAISDTASEFYRNSEFFQACGKDYIAHAFRVAHEVSPSTKLYYNDYNMDDPVKRAKVIEMITELKADGVPIDGVGMQGHYKTRRFNYVEFEKAIVEFAEIGMDVQITELDFSIYLSDSEKFTELSNELATLQATAYAKCFEILRKHSDKVSSVTTWGLADDHTWLDNYPVKNRKDFPLLFDGSLEPKPAFFAVRDFK